MWGRNPESLGLWIAGLLAAGGVGATQEVAVALPILAVVLTPWLGDWLARRVSLRGTLAAAVVLAAGSILLRPDMFVGPRSGLVLAGLVSATAAAFGAGWLVDRWRPARAIDPAGGSRYEPGRGIAPAPRGPWTDRARHERPIDRANPAVARLARAAASRRGSPRVQD